MIRQHANARSGASNGNNGISKQSSENSPTTIREIRSRTIGSTSSTNARHLLVNRRQATSMERLNSSATVVSSPNSNNERDKSSPSSGSSNSINNSSITSPLRTGGTANGGLNRTASRVSRFRSAKAVFERLSSSNNTSNKLDRPAGLEKPRGTIASRYAAAAAARATTHAATSTNLSTSPRSRLPIGSLARSQESGKSASNIEIHRLPNNSPKSDSNQPKPQPRVISNKATINACVMSSSSDISNRTKHSNTSSTPTKTSTNPKPPPKDLIDKIVLEIARDAGKENPDANCTIQDLSNCDISGIPETLDFDKCFQDVEMMTEEEARKLLSKKPDASPSPNVSNQSTDYISVAKTIESNEDTIDIVTNESSSLLVDNSTVNDHLSDSSNPSVSSISKCKVRFSDEPVKIYSTHAVEDYDRRNDDIDPVAASAEYEIEKSKERVGLKDSDDEDSNETVSERTDLTMHSQQGSNNLGNSYGAPHNFHNAPRNDLRDSSDEHSAAKELNQTVKGDEELESNKEYIESLEREVALKRILEQNLRDLQSQYYEAVKELDDYRGTTELKLSDLNQNLSDLNSKFESSQNDLTDAREQSNTLDKQLNDIKESSQTLEKKYHRAKRIIKDMQSREQSFNRREQLYQQKLDEIEYELGVLIESIDKTIYEDGLEYYSLTDIAACQRQHQAQLNVFGLIRQMLSNFNANQSTQNPQIKQRVVSILEQQLANLMSSTNGNTTVSNNVNLVPTAKSISSDNTNYQLASHRLSQPNLPHPIGVSGQPTKLFHGLSSANEPSPPQSVNSYPSTNSLNSLNNNNNNSTNNNNIVTNNKPSASDLQLNIPSTANSNIDDKFQPALDIQVPYQTNEWHDKPVSEWTTTQVSTWLLALGLDQYISKFEDRNVNGQSLINLDSTVLKGLGVLNSNDRNLLKKKIRELRVEMEKERKLIEKKMKENLKSKNKSNGAKTDNRTDIQQNKPSWKRSLLS